MNITFYFSWIISRSGTFGFCRYILNFTRNCKVVFLCLYHLAFLTKANTLGFFFFNKAILMGSFYDFIVSLI